MSNQITVSADHLEQIFEQVVLLDIDASQLALALQAVQIECAVSRGIVQAVIMALSGIAATSGDISDQLSGMLSAPQGVIDHE